MRQVAAADADSSRAHYRRGVALMQLARAEEAAAAFRAGIAAAPASKRLQASLAAAEAAARAAFQQHRSSAGGAALGGRRGNAERQARPQQADPAHCSRRVAQATHRAPEPAQFRWWVACVQTLSCSEGLWGYAPTGACPALTAGEWQAEWEAEAARAVLQEAHARQAAVSRGAAATDPAGELRRDELSPSQARRQAVLWLS